MHSRSIFLLAVFFLTLPSQSMAQTNEGTHFWMGFMEHHDIGKNTKVAMITAKTNTSGTIQIPLRNWSQDFTVTANEVTLITLPDYTENRGSENVDNTGIQITASSPVSVYIHQYFNARAEATVVLPVHSLGNDYFVMTYTGVKRDGEIFPSEFLLVAPQDETLITIEPSDATKKGREAMTSFTVSLDAGETYQVQSRDEDGDLTGTRVYSDKKFAIFGGNRWTEVPTGCFARDNLMEQMYPLSTWGRKFVTVPHINSNYDIFRIMAAEDGTRVNVSGSSNKDYIINKGQFIEYSESIPSFISADKGILVAQFTIGVRCMGHSVGDPSMVLLNSIEQTRDTVTLYNSKFQNISENYINIIAQTLDLDFIYFDGEPLLNTQANIQTVGADGFYSYAQLPVNAGAHTIVSGGCGVIASAYGYGDLESYAYSGGASFTPINTDPIPDGGCLNDTVFFNTGLSPRRFSFDWDLGDGNRSTEASFQHFYPQLGSYRVELRLTDLCLGTVDTLQKEIHITLRQAVESVPQLEVCEGEMLSFSATDVEQASYQWTGPNNYFSTRQFPVIQNARPKQSGSYSVIGIVSGCATFPAFAEVIVHPTPQPQLGPDTFVCTQYGDVLNVLNPGVFQTYRWQDGSRSPSFTLEQDGRYWVEVSDEFECTGSDEVTLTERCATAVYVPTAFSPNYDGINDTFGPYGHNIIRLHMRVYDRWGALVFESHGLDDHWDGTQRGTTAAVGIYMWVMDLEGYGVDGSQFSETRSGTVVLMGKR